MCCANPWALSKGFFLFLENVATITELITFANCFISSMYSYKWKTHTISTIIKCWNNQDLTFHSEMWWAEGKRVFWNGFNFKCYKFVKKRCMRVCFHMNLHSVVMGVEFLHRVWSFAISILRRPSMLFKPLTWQHECKICINIDKNACLPFTMPPLALSCKIRM